MSRRLYSLVLWLVAPFAFAVVLWRGIRDRSYWQGLGERFGWGAGRSTRSVWLHAVSLGEMSAAAPLVRALRTKYPQIPLLLTTATPTGRGRAQALFDDVEVRFLPYDTPGSVKRFLDRVRPRLAIIVETELWPNLFSECARRGVPVLLASARLSEKSVVRYRRFGGLFRGIFSASVSTAAQTLLDAERFIAIGAAAERTHVVGNIKFDLELSPEVVERGRRLRAAFGNARPTWIAGSTHEGEEEAMLAAHERLRGQWPEALLLLAPRHPARFQAVADLLSRRGVSFALRSGGNRSRTGTGGPNGSGSGGERGGGGTNDRGDGGERGGGRNSDASNAEPVSAFTQVLLVDTVGELVTLYAAADVAFVGGSLVPVGGHNLLEPAALGLPVLTGPYDANGRDIARLMLRQGAAMQVNDAQELAAALQRLLGDPAERQRVGAIGRSIVESNRGAVSRLLELIDPMLNDPTPGAGSPAEENR